MLTEKRIQVYLPEREYKAIRSRARAEGKSLAGLVREATREYLTRTPADRIAEGYRMLEEISGKSHDKEGKTDVAENHDFYLTQGPPWRW